MHTSASSVLKHLHFHKRRLSPSNKNCHRFLSNNNVLHVGGKVGQATLKEEVEATMLQEVLVFIVVKDCQPQSYLVVVQL